MTTMPPALEATVLVVDDEPLNRRLLVALLQAEGYRTLTATNGEAALASIAADPPDLILLDVMMPGMDGYEVASLVKADPATSNIPIIMVSALSQRDARVSGLQAGAEDFLSKPVDKGELWLRVRNLLRLKEMGDRLQDQSAALEQQVQDRTADLRQLAHYDALTCVPNRTFLYEILRKALPVAAATGWHVAVMFLDIDHFKDVNDTFGHAVGDGLLAQFSARLVAAVRLRDTVGRLGGDEFALVVLLDAEQEDGAATVADKLMKAIQEPFSVSGADVAITASIGIAVSPQDGEDAESLLKHADTAMYRAKEAGRDTFRFFTSTMHAEATARLETEAAGRKRTQSTGVLALSLLDDMDAPTCAVDGAGVITALNRAWSDVTSPEAAVPPGTAVGSSYADVLAAHPAIDADAALGGLQRLLAGEGDRFVLAYSTGAGMAERCFKLVAFPLADGAGAVLSHVEITPAGRTGSGVAVQPSHDALTSLVSRDCLLEVLARALEADQGERPPLAAACLGIDGLKHVNDSYGYAAGDELLIRVSDRLAQHVRDGDTLARFAGDEFVVIWPLAATEAQTDVLAQRLAAAFDAPFQLTAGTVSVTASIGVALGGAPQSGEDLLLAASAAMRDAKRRGPGRTSVYTSDQKRNTRSRIRLEAEIRGGIARREFVLYYQPVIDLQQRTVTGVEALVRWQHPDGLRMPDDFIPVAERSGLIVPLGAWIVDEACRQAAEWAGSGLELTMGVNLSARQVADPGLLSIVESALHRADIPAQRLLLEITESAVIEDAELALTALESLHRLGAGIAIDDFGTGYSSLLYLKRYPIHTLKIDRAFVAGMGINANDDAIVASIVHLAGAVNAVSTAEGVETTEQAVALRALGCRSAQGYFFARPTPAQDLPDTVRELERQLRTPLLIPVARSRARHAIPATVVDRVDTLHQQGASLHTIAAALNADASAGPGGARWSSAAVGRVLHAQDEPADQPASS